MRNGNAGNMNMKRKKKRTDKSEGTPEEIRLFNQLCEALRQAGIETRVEKGDFRGGICLVEGEKEILFINKKHPMPGRLALLIAELKKIAAGEELPEELQAQIDAWQAKN